MDGFVRPQLPKRRDALTVLAFPGRFEIPVSASAVSDRSLPTHPPTSCHQPIWCIHGSFIRRAPFAYDRSLGGLPAVVRRPAFNSPKRKHDADAAVAKHAFVRMIPHSKELAKGAHLSGLIAYLIYFVCVAKAGEGCCPISFSTWHMRCSESMRHARGIIGNGGRKAYGA